MKIKPLADRVLIKPMASEEKTIGGIIIPDSAKEKPLQGEIVAVGNGTKDEELILKEGDNVLFGKYEVMVQQKIKFAPNVVSRTKDIGVLNHHVCLKQTCVF